jgi:hypothetical protein
MRAIGYRDKKRIRGYLVFSFRPAKEENWLLNDLTVTSLVYENREVLAELLTFLRSQADQIDYIGLSTEDENFHFLVRDPRTGSNNIVPPLSHECTIQGLGIMYRVLDTRALFRILIDHDFGNQTGRLKITIKDSFFPVNQGSTIVHFINGRPHLKKGIKPDVEIILDVSDFSSLLMGVVGFKTLYSYRLAEISNPKYLEMVEEIFRTQAKPVSTTQF